MSAGLVAVEYPKGSGTEIAVAKTQEQAKPIFAFEFNTRTADGSRSLIRDRIAFPLHDCRNSEKVISAISRFERLAISIIFDLDGVLVDTSELECHSLRGAIVRLGGQEPTDKELKAALGHSPREALRSLSNQPIGQLVSAYHEGWRAAVGKKVRPSRHITSVISRLHQASTALAVVTSRNKQQAELLLSAAGLEDMFPVLVSWGDTGTHKPSPEPLLEAVRNSRYQLQQST